MKRGFVLLAGAVLIPTALALSGVAAGEALSIYQQGIAAVQEVRTLPATFDPSDLRLLVPQGLLVDSLLVDLAGTVLSQAFHFTPPESVLSASIGKKIEVLAQGGDYPRLLRGTLLAAGDPLVIQDDRGQVHVVHSPLSVTLPPEDRLALEAYVSLRVEGENLAGSEAALSYLTSGLTWSADYLGFLSEDETTLSLRGAVTLANTSGWGFAQASVRLVAGEISQVAPTFKSARYAAVPMAEAAFQESAAFEYHVYTLASPVDLPDRASFAIPYTASPAVAAKKTFAYDGAQTDAVRVALEFVNDVASGLGIPLPAGTVRLFQRSEAGTLLLGEDAIGHTPIDEKVSLTVGSAFDLVGERVQVGSERIATSTYRESYRVTLRNHKATGVTIAVLEHPAGSSWEVLTSSMAYERVDARTIRFQVEVPANGEAVVDYTVEYSY